MNLKQLQYFLAVAEELHFNKAAEKLRVSQPPLSRQIQQLEHDVGVKLFERTKRSVKLTAAGEYLQTEATQLIKHIDSIKNQLSLIDQGTLGRLRIGYVGAVMHSLLPYVLKELKSHYPGIGTILHEMDSETQLEALNKGKLDIGFIRTPMEVDQIESVPIIQETFSVIISSDHSLGKRDHIDLLELASEPFIGFPRECAPGMVDTINSICIHAGFSPNKIHESSQINTIIRLVESNLGYSIIPSGVCSVYHLKIKTFELANISERAEIALIYNPKSASPLLRNVIALFANYASSPK
jgi:DNA-binding transcriptional LysR family regulator